MTDINLAPRALCDVDDVISYVPGYEPEEDTQDTLIRLINAESRSAHQRCDREFKVTGTNPQLRLFDIVPGVCRTRRVRVGDLASVALVRVLEQDGQVVETVTAANYVLWPRVREEWEPARAVWFPPATASPALIAPGRVLEVTGNYGFPAVPDDVREAVAKMVIVRYLSDVAESGTKLSDAIAEISVGGLLRSASAALEGYAQPGFA